MVSPVSSSIPIPKSYEIESLPSEVQNRQYPLYNTENVLLNDFKFQNGDSFYRFRNRDNSVSITKSDNIPVVIDTNLHTTLKRSSSEIGINGRQEKRRKISANEHDTSNGHSSGTEAEDVESEVALLATDYTDIIESFQKFPRKIKLSLLSSLLAQSDRSSLSVLSQSIVKSLQFDFISHLPSELTSKILMHLDYQDLCRCAKVSKNWNYLFDSNENVWRVKLKEDLGFTMSDLSRAHSENWSYTNWGQTEPLTKQINIYKAIYRRKYLLIHRNWMDKRFKPKRLTIQGNGSDVITCLQFDDNKIITGSDDHTITIHDTATGNQLHKLVGHEGGVWALQYVSNLVVSGSTDRTVRVWDVRTGRNTHIFHGHTSTVRCLEVLLPVNISNDPSNPIMAPQYPVIVTGSRDATLRVWRLPDENSLSMDSTVPESSENYLLRTLQGHSSSVRALSGYGNTVVSGSYDASVRVWNIENGSCKWVLTGHAQRVYSAILDHKRNRCISGSMDWFVKVWCLETGTQLYTLEGHTSLVGLLDLNRNTLVSAAADSTLRVWDPETGNSLHKLEGHVGAITCFQHDEYKVISGSERTLKLWNIKTGKLVQDLLQNLTRIWQVRFDSRKCVAAVQRNELTYIEVLDFDNDPYSKEHEN